MRLMKVGLNIFVVFSVFLFINCQKGNNVDRVSGERGRGVLVTIDSPSGRVTGYYQMKEGRIVDVTFVSVDAKSEVIYRSQYGYLDSSSVCKGKHALFLFDGTLFDLSTQITNRLTFKTSQVCIDPPYLWVFSKGEKRIFVRANEVTLRVGRIVLRKAVIRDYLVKGDSVANTIKEFPEILLDDLLK